MQSVMDLSYPGHEEMEEKEPPKEKIPVFYLPAIKTLNVKPPKFMFKDGKDDSSSMWQVADLMLFCDAVKERLPKLIAHENFSPDFYCEFTYDDNFPPWHDAVDYHAIFED